MSNDTITSSKSNLLNKRSSLHSLLSSSATILLVAADEEEEEQEQEQEEQQEDTEDSGGESGDDKCMVCGEREEDDVDIEEWVACEMCSQWIHSKFIPSNHPYSISQSLPYLFTVAIFIEY